MDTGQIRFALRPLELKHFFDFSLRLYRANFVPMLLAMAIVQLPMTLLSLPFITSFMTVVEEVSEMNMRGDLNFDTFLMEYLDTLVWAVVAMFGAMAYQMLVMPLGNLACARLASQSLLGEPQTFREAFRFSTTQYLVTQVAIAVFLLPLLGISLVALAPVLIASGSGDPTGIAVSAGLGILAIFAASIGTGLLFFRYFFAVDGIVQAVEEPEGDNLLQRGLWYLKRSWSLSQGHAMRIFGFLLLLWIAVYMITGGIQDSLRLIIIFVTELGSMESGGELVSRLAAPQDPLQTGIVLALSGLFTALITPVWQCFKTLQYFDLRCRKEGFDLYKLLEEQRAESRSAPESMFG